MDRIAQTLNVPLEKMLERAGFKVSLKRNASKALLGRIHDLLSAGCLDLAILQLLRLNDRIAGSNTAVTPIGGGVRATEFARAVVLLDRLPKELLELTLKAMQARFNANWNDPEGHPQLSTFIRKECMNALTRQL